MYKDTETATFGGGCFWCTEAIFQSLKGVEKVVSGYSGGHKEFPSYNEVASGKTGHAEVIQITFNPKIISYEDLLQVFFETHNPTELNKQGNDLGSQYRSIILFHNENQKQIAEKIKANINSRGKFKDKVVTEIKAFENFYEAESYHQNYYLSNPGNPYCTLVISPKLKKLKEKFTENIK